MVRVRLGRLFWIGAAALLCAAALISLVALVRGEFTATDNNILLTLGAAFLTGSAAIAWYALVERGTLTRLGWAAVATAPVWAGVLAFAHIWEVPVLHSLTGRPPLLRAYALRSFSHFVTNTSSMSSRRTVPRSAPAN